MDKHRCLQVTSTPAIAASMNVATGSVVQDNTLNIKEEQLDTELDIGPIVLQHMDAPFRPVQPEVNIIKQERSIKDNDIDPTQCSVVKEEISEDEQEDAQYSKEETQPEQRAQSRLYGCDKCTKRFTGRQSFYSHYKRFHGTGYYKCTECNKKYICRAYLARHIRFVHGKQQHACTICKKMCNSIEELSVHVTECHGRRSAADTDSQHSNKATQSEQQAQSQVYSCDMGGETSVDSLMQHYRNEHSTDSHKCIECNKKFPSKSYLNIHTTNAHSKQQCECAVCKKIFKSRTCLNKHINRVHRPRPAAVTDAQCSNDATQSEQRPWSQLYSCDKCEKTYTSKKCLMQHYRNLHSIEPHKCTKCNKEFSSKSYLHIHTSNAHSKQEYECAVCKKIYKWESGLRHHVDKVHRLKPAADTDVPLSNKASQSKQQAPSQLYSCHNCVKTYTSKKCLMHHYRNLHSTESHKCTKCNKKCSSASYLDIHTRYAHSEQQYECAVCKKLYKSKLDLHKHVYNIHRPRPAGNQQLYTCTNCAKNFKYKQTCQRHEKRGKCTRPTASSTSAAASTSAQQPNVVIVKVEPADGELDLGPTVFQHMDCNYRPYKQEPDLD